jgi:hypothetical protein
MTKPERALLYATLLLAAINAVVQTVHYLKGDCFDTNPATYQQETT